MKSPSLMATFSDDDCGGGDGDDAGDGAGGSVGGGSAPCPGFNCISGSSSIYYMYLLFYVSSIYVCSTIKPI